MECINAIATTIIALFTALLWCSTNKLWKATKESIDLGREEFIAAYPPKLRVHNVDLLDSSVIREKSKITFDITNIGGNNALVIERNFIFKKLDPFPPNPSYFDSNNIDVHEILL